MIRQAIETLPDGTPRTRHPFEAEIWNYVLRTSHDFESFLDNCTGIVFDSGCYKSFLFNQIDYLTNGAGEPVVDFVGRFERLEEDAGYLFRRIGVEAALPRLNASCHGLYRDYYTARTRDLVAQRFARDIERFGYRF
jgi:hypothetical protein